MTDREEFEAWLRTPCPDDYKCDPKWAAYIWQAATAAALAAPATAPEPVAWLRAGAGLYCGYQTCEVNDENGFPVYRHPPATAPAWHDAQQAEIESLRWTVKDALESLDNGMTADCRATLSSATKETP